MRGIFNLCKSAQIPFALSGKAEHVERVNVSKDVFIDAIIIGWIMHWAYMPKSPVSLLEHFLYQAFGLRYSIILHE